MQVEKDKVVSLHYTLRLDDGQVVDSSEKHGPLKFLVGHSQIIPGLENELIGLKKGDEKPVKVKPEDAYGLGETALVQTVDRNDIPDSIALNVGEVLRGQGEDGQVFEGRIKTVGDSEVEIDFNHPLAGEMLHFETKIEDIRDATEEEIAHKHVH